MAARSLASRKANGWRARAKAFIEPDPAADPAKDAQERNTRLGAIIKAIDRRLALEVVRDHPNGELLRDLATTRRTLLSQADGPKAAAPPPAERTAPPDPELPASQS
jgi:hypothetical protein